MSMSTPDFKNSIFNDPSPQQFKALEHLCQAVTSVERVTTNADVTLGILSEVLPLVILFKKLERVKDEADSRGGSSSNLSLGDDVNANVDGDGDAMNFDDLTGQSLSQEDKDLHDHIEAEFLRLSRNPSTRKPNFRAGERAERGGVEEDENTSHN